MLALRLRIVANGILIPAELELLGRLRERRAAQHEAVAPGWNSLDGVYQAVIDAENEPGYRAVLDASYQLRDWLQAAREELDENVQLPLDDAGSQNVLSFDQMLGRLVTRFDRRNWKCLDREINAQFVTQFMPAFVVSCLGFNLRGRVQAAPGPAQRFDPPCDSETAARIGQLTLLMMRFVQPDSDQLRAWVA